MPQTKREIEAMLAAAGLRPDRRLGQHFLIDGNLMRKLVVAAELAPDDVVLEVGPGTGSLTEMLLDAAGHVVAVEVDRDLCALLQARLADRANLTLLGLDALASKHALAPELVEAVRAARQRVGGACRLVANLPYSIASPLIIDLLLSDLGVDRFCFTVQAEVADRLASPPGRKSYGPLSVAVQALCDVRAVADLPPSVFWPRPGVGSRMLRLDRVPAKAARIADLPHLVHVVRTCFLLRRKKLVHGLAPLRPGERIDAAEWGARLGCDLSRRPEELAVEEWIALADALRRAAPP